MLLDVRLSLARLHADYFVKLADLERVDRLRDPGGGSTMMRATTWLLVCRRAGVRNGGDLPFWNPFDWTAVGSDQSTAHALSSV